LVRERIEHDELVFDQAIVRHGYADHMRDYDVLVEPYTSAGALGCHYDRTGGSATDSRTARPSPS
jgi:hypothetical protein